MTAYAIKRDDKIRIDTICFYKNECINSLVKWAEKYTWSELKKFGYSVVKVEIKEVEK